VTNLLFQIVKETCSLLRKTRHLKVHLFSLSVTKSQIFTALTGLGQVFQCKLQCTGLYVQSSVEVWMHQGFKCVWIKKQIEPIRYLHLNYVAVIRKLTRHVYLL